MSNPPQPNSLRHKNPRLKRNTRNVQTRAQRIEPLLRHDSHEREECARVIDDEEPEVDADDAAVALGEFEVRGYEAHDLDYGGGDGHEHHGPLDTAAVGPAECED
jgi:hypothetical protein